MTRPRLPLVALCVSLALLGAACTSGDGDPAPNTDAGATIQAFWANYETLTGVPNRVEVGLLTTNNLSLSYGTVRFDFSYLGSRSDPSAPQPGPSATAHFILRPGMQASDQQQPSLTQPAVARGVYEAEGVSFDQAGFWSVKVSANLADGSAESASAEFPVVDKPAYPAPGEKAPKTENLTTSSKGVPAAAVDSRALTGGMNAVPEPWIHNSTIADAIAAHHPVFALFSTPVYCISKFCGPVTDEFAQVAKRYADRADFVHVEIYEKYTTTKKVVNRAAADWVYRTDITEPWLFFVGADGKIVDRWQNLVDFPEVQQALQKLPPMH